MHIFTNNCGIPPTRQAREKTMTEMYIYKNMSHASHKTNQDISDLGIVQGQNKSIPNITVPCPLSLISKADQLIYNPTIINEDVPIGKFIQAYFNFFNATSI